MRGDLKEHQPTERQTEAFGTWRPALDRESPFLVETSLELNEKQEKSVRSGNLL
jgi:hypothetical protein